MPTKVLPEKIDIHQLKQQAKDLLKGWRLSDPAAQQRFREFHPAGNSQSRQLSSEQQFTLSDAQFALAREYGIASWRRLREIAAGNLGIELDLAHHERIEDPLFRKAVDFIDEGDVDALQSLLGNYPSLITRTVEFEGGNYFQRPTLLEFVAGNPVRHDSLPDNIVSVAKLLLESGAKQHIGPIDYTLGLVCSGRVMRESGAQLSMIDLLCEYGANPDGAISTALGHGEFEAAEALIKRGARVDLPVAAAMGLIDNASELLPAASSEQRHQALALSTQHGQVAIVELLLVAGEDPNRYNPVGYHAHSTPLHQAAIAGHFQTVKVLVGHGARADIPDIHFKASARDWASHGGYERIAKFLE